MKRLLTAFFGIVFSLSGFCQHGSQLQQVSDRLYMVQGNGGNVTFLVSDQGVVVVDAGALEMDGKKIVELVKSVTDKEIKYLIVTHYHYDHTFGACGFPEGTTIIGHRNVVNNIRSYGHDYLHRYKNEDLGPKVAFLKNRVDSLKQIKDSAWQKYEERYLSHAQQLENLDKTHIVYPNITFSNTMSLYLGKDTVNLIFPNNTHTNDNILVAFINQNALVTGDFFFNQCLPFIDDKTNCDTENWIDMLAEYSAKTFDYVIPGHGELAKPSAMLLQAEYLKDLRTEVAAMIASNKSLKEIKGEVKMEKYADWGYQFMLSSEIDAVYNELTDSLK